MNAFCCMVLLLLATTLIFGQVAQESKPSVILNQPEELVRSLYVQVVARHPLGIPHGADMKVFGPKLSKALHHRFELSNACFNDWKRQNSDPNLKPSIGLIENGIFSGGDVKAEPRAFHIERTELENDGSFRVYVRLSWGTRPEMPLIWHVAVVVIREDDHFVVDDVIYLKDKSRKIESRLSEELSPGCDGLRWVGHSTHRR
jgi:hypothetical protein